MKNTDIKRKILEIKPFDPKDYQALDIDRLVVFSLFFLEKKKVPLYFEYIAVALFKLFPKKFSLVNFGRYPDTFRVNNAVRRLAGSLKNKGAKWANGNVENGFSLTETGREIAKQVKEFLDNPVEKVPKMTRGRSRGRSPLNDVSDLKNSVAFKKWVVDPEEVTNYDIFSLLGAMPYAPKELLRDHLEYLSESANETNDKKAALFLKWVKTKFSTIFVP